MQIAMRVCSAACGSVFALYAVVMLSAGSFVGWSTGAALAALTALCMWFARTGRRSWWPALFGPGAALVLYHATLAGLELIPHSDAWRGAFVVGAAWAFVALWHASHRRLHRQPHPQVVGDYHWGQRLRTSETNSGAAGMLTPPDSTGRRP